MNHEIQYNYGDYSILNICMMNLLKVASKCVFNEYVDVRCCVYVMKEFMAANKCWCDDFVYDNW